MRFSLRRAWSSAPLDTRQYVLFMANLLMTAALIMTILLSARPVMDLVLEDRSSNELKLLEETYVSKVNQISLDSQKLVSHEELQAVLLDPDHSTEELERMLYSASIEYEAEYWSLTDLHVPAQGVGAVIRAGANGNRSGDVLDPGGFLEDLTCCTAEPSQTVGSALLSFEEYTAEGPVLFRERNSEFNPIVADHVEDLEVTGLVRWVVTPVLMPSEDTFNVEGKQLVDCTDGVTAALVVGDLVNGKVPIVEDTIEAFGTGYSAVWYLDDATTEGVSTFRQAASYLGFNQGGTSSVLAGYTISDDAFLGDGYGSTSVPINKWVTLLSDRYMMSAKRLPDTPVVLVRGTAESEVTSRYDELVTVALIVAGVGVVADALLCLYCTRWLVQPLLKLARRIQRQSKRQVLVVGMDELPSGKRVLMAGGAACAATAVALFVLLAEAESAVEDVKASGASSEVKVLDYFYGEKLHSLERLVAWEADQEYVHDLIDDYYHGHAGGNCGDFKESNATLHLREELKTHTKDLKAELAFLVDRTGLDIIVSANGQEADDNRCEFIDPSGIVSAIFDAPKIIVKTSVFVSTDYLSLFTDEDSADYHEEFGDVASQLSAEVTSSDVLMRWVAQPVYSTSTLEAAKEDETALDEVDAVLLIGDSMNGKMATLAHLYELYGDGYAAVYQFDEALQDFALSVSLLAKDGVLEADVSLPDTQILLDALTAEDHFVTRNDITIAGYSIGAQQFVVAVDTPPEEIWIDEFGSRSVDTDVFALMVRGVPIEVTGEAATATDTLKAVTISALVALIVLRVVIVYVTFLPVVQLRTALRALGVLVRSLSAGSSSTQSGVGGRSRHERPWKIVFFPAKWILIGGQVGVVFLLLTQYMDWIASEHPVEAVAGLITLSEQAILFLHLSQAERTASSRMVESGWDEELNPADWHAYRDEVTEARLNTDNVQAELLATMAAVDTTVLDSEAVDALSVVRREVYAIRHHRIEVDTDEELHTEEAIHFYTELNVDLLHLLEATYRLATGKAAMQVMFSTLMLEWSKEHLSEESQKLAVAVDGAWDDDAAVEIARLITNAEISLDVYHETVVTSHDHLLEDTLSPEPIFFVEGWRDALHEFPAELVMPDFPANHSDLIYNNYSITVEEMREVSVELLLDFEHVSDSDVAELQETEDAVYSFATAYITLGCCGVLCVLHTRPLKRIRDTEVSKARSKLLSKIRNSADAGLGNRLHLHYKYVLLVTDYFFQRHVVKFYALIQLGVFIVAMVHIDHELGDKADGDAENAARLDVAGRVLRAARFAQALGHERREAVVTIYEGWDDDLGDWVNHEGLDHYQELANDYWVDFEASISGYDLELSHALWDDLTEYRYNLTNHLNADNLLEDALTYYTHMVEEAVQVVFHTLHDAPTGDVARSSVGWACIMYRAEEFALVEALLYPYIANSENYPEEKLAKVVFADEAQQWFRDVAHGVLLDTYDELEHAWLDDSESYYNAQDWLEHASQHVYSLEPPEMPYSKGEWIGNMTEVVDLFFEMQLSLYNDVRHDVEVISDALESELDDVEISCGVGVVVNGLLTLLAWAVNRGQNRVWRHLCLGTPPASRVMAFVAGGFDTDVLRSVRDRSKSGHSNSQRMQGVLPP